MGVQFDWEVEDAEPAPRLDAESSEAGHDNRIRRLIGWGVVAVMLGVAAYGGFRWTQRRVDERLHQELEAVVSAELTTLRIGDENAFEKLQTGSEEWLSTQSHTFERYQQGASSYQYLSGEVSDMTVEAGQGTVYLPGDRDGQPFCVVWRYEYTRDGWQHADSPPELCGGDALRLEGHHVAIYTYPADAAYSQDLLDRIDPWLEDLCALTECASYPRPLTVRVLPDYSIIPRLEDETTLVIPSPALTPEAGRPAEFDWTVVSRLSTYWAEEMLRTAALEGRESRWMRDNLGQLAFATWNGDPAETYLGGLVASYGRDVVQKLLADLVAGQTPEQALNGVIGPEALGSADPESAFEILLQTEAMLLESDNKVAAAAYRDPERRFPAEWNSFLAEANPASIQVASIFQTGFNDEIQWAEVYWRPLSDAPFRYGGIHAAQYTAYIPFRQVEGRWARTAILPDDYGPLQEQTLRHVTVTYRADDERLVAPLLAALDEIYPWIAADVGLDTLPPVHLLLTPSTVEYLDWWEEEHPPSPESIDLAAISSYEWCCSAGQSLEQTIISRTKYQLVRSVVDTKTSSLSRWDDLNGAFVNWFAREYGLIDELPYQAAYRDMLVFTPVGSPVSEFPSTLLQLWLDLKLDVPSSGGTTALSAGVLVDVLMDTYGPGAMEPLLASLAEADTLDDWLMMSVGAPVDFIEPLWQARMEEVLADIHAEAQAMRQTQGTQ